MKKIFTLCISLLMGCVALNAQTFAFVDGDGNVINNGTTVTMPKEIHVDDLTGETYIPLTGVSVKNISSTDGNCDVTFTVIELPGGKFQACCLGSCNAALTAVGATDTYDNISRSAGATATLSGTEWYNGGMGTKFTDIFGDYYDFPLTEEGIVGTCKMKVSVAKSGNSTPDSEIYIDFIYEGTGAGISGVENEKDNAVVGYYTIDGVKLNAPQKGLNIVKRADGTTTKVLVK